MEDSRDLKNKYCCGCLCSKDEYPLQYYTVQNGVLKSIFQVDEISLCYLCRRMAKHAEHFIQTVQSNQILLENVHSLTVLTIESAKAQTQPLKSLSRVALDIIELSGHEETNLDESFSVIYNCSNNEEVKIKLELKEEDGEMLDLNLEGEFMGDDNDFQEPYVKDEAFPLKALFKQELEIEGIDLKCLRKSLKKKKKLKKKLTMPKREMKLAKVETSELRYIERIFITREQCLEERIKMAEDSKYLNSLYKCEDCIKGFTFKASYEKHMEKHSESYGDYECDICKQRMNSEEKLYSHKRYHEVRYKCPECDLVRISRLTIKDHYSACHGHYKHSCTQCSKVYNRQVSLRKHIAYAHAHRERVTCAYCHKSYANKTCLKTHLTIKHPKEVSAGEIRKKHVCQECGMAFKAPSQLRNHAFKHSLSRDYYCVECDKSFKSESILKHHLKTTMSHVNYVELPLPCLHCDKRFAIRRDLERHTNRVHLNVKPFQCDRCEKAYVNNWNLREHKRLVHEGYKRPLKYPCPMCDKVFDRNQILKSHIRTHTGERPYQCSKCPAQFSQGSILRTHIKLIHLKLTRDGRPKAVALK